MLSMIEEASEKNILIIRQNLDFEAIKYTLKSLTNQEGHEWLQKNSPGLYIYVNKRMGLNAQAARFMAENEKFLRGDNKNYSRYVHGFLLPELEKRRQSGMILKSKFSVQTKRETCEDQRKKLQIGAHSFDYIGETDRDGLACGYGVAVSEVDKTWSFSGTWLKNEQHGLCRFKNISLTLCIRRRGIKSSIWWMV